ncbi:MAG TPA: hypothetical protein DEU95_06355 [Chloroflexi bacterium]|jgi:hypothetical protein|nr:hypothetical protein [Chloroflexota bacterium]HCG29358.1 hypothetical protein [Chloroflexota bacterium]
MPAPYTLHLHLVTGSVIDLACSGYEITPGGGDDHGNQLPPTLHYTPPDGWERTIQYLDMRGVVAIEVTRSPAQIALDARETAGDGGQHEDADAA